MRATQRFGAAAAAVAAVVVVAAVVAVAPSPVYAQPADVVAQIKLIETQPADMDRATWKDKRRDAARRLGQSKDRRAVPVLIKLAETETFDIIGEIAIEGLGNLGDPAAVPALQRIVADPTRDKGQKDLARKALGKLGSDARAPAPGASPAPAAPAAAPTAPAVTEPAPLATHLAAPPAAAPPPATATAAAAAPQLATAPASAPALPDDTLAAYERVTFAGGTANAGYDTVRKRVDFDADVAGQYQKRIERETMAWGWDGGAHVVGGYINPDGPAVTRGLQIDVTGDGEIRFYSGQVYAIGKAAGELQVNYISDVDPNNPNNTLKDTRSTADLQIALGAGYGRLLDVGAAIRVRRLGRALEAAHALGRPIDPSTARRLQLTWWALRGDRSTYRALVSTVAILREAGVLLGEPDAGLSYELLNVLRDSQLYLRPSGLDAQLVFGEGYLQRPDQPASNEAGRVEQLLAAANYGAQLDDDTLELSGGAYGRLRLFAPANQPSPWAIGATASARRFTYGEHGDPYGALDLSAELQISNDDLMTSQIGQRLTGELGFTWWINPASGFRLAASLAEDRGAVVIGAQLSATYGLLDGTFAR